MPIRSLIIVWLLLAIGFACTASLADDDSTPQSDLSVSESAVVGIERGHVDFAFRGAASCAAAGCHGGPTPGQTFDRSVRGSEYSLWLERDPHATSWRTICSDLSLQILQKLGIVKSGTIVKTAAYHNCLACHSTTNKLNEDGLTPVFAEGVGCEACHGPSQGWYHKHFRIDWTQTPGNLPGMTETGPLVQRARLCASCHVGSKDRDMNHDIVAAGHPALHFDMASFHERYPKHWRDPNEFSDDMRSRLWMAGQVAVVEAELELLLARVSSSHAVSVWPEFSSYKCSSCHFELGSQSRALDGIDRTFEIGGRANVRTWNLGGVQALQRLLQHQESLELEVAIDRLTNLLGQPNSSRMEIEQSATAARQAIEDSLKSGRDPNLAYWNRQKQMEFAKDLLRDIATTNDWASACRAYTASWAALSARTSQMTRPDLAIIRQGLLFPSNTQSARFPLPDDGPGTPTRQRWETALQSVASQLNLEQP